MRVFLIAGEPSGDALGGALMAALKSLQPDISFDGVGGPAMQAHGLDSRFEMSELSVMGIAEVLPKYRHLKRRICEMADAVITTKPDVLITIDAPDFSLRVAKLVKAASDVRTVHYVAPSVWAWRPKRAEKMARCIDHVLALLPFEPPYMEAAGMDCDFVGHPIVSEPVASRDEAQAFKVQLGVDDADPLVLVLPGSRKSEVSRLAPIFGQTLDLLAKDRNGLRAVMVVAPNVAPLVTEMIADWPVKPVTVNGADAGAKRAAFAAADVALAASGTVALELAANAVPMVIGYKMKALSHWIISRMALIDSVNLVNIVTDTRHVPECLGPGCTPAALSHAMAQVLQDPSAQKRVMAQMMQSLGQGDEPPQMRDARAVLSRM